MGRTLIIVGLVLVAIGILFTYSARLPFRIGRLPGDIHIKRANFSFHFPLMTCLLISAVISFIAWLFRR